MYWNEMVHSFFNALKGLTLTWDVLKLHGNIGVTTATARLTLTWDVLKCVTTVLCCRCVND